MRVFLFGVVAILAAISLGCESQMTSSGIAIERSFRGLVWPDATVLAGVDVESLQKTALYQRYSQQLSLPLLNDAPARLGFDPRHDVATLLFESDGQRSLLLAHGNLQDSQIRQKLGAAGARSATYHSFQVLGDERNSLALLKDSVALGGSAVAVRSALDLSETKAGAVPAELQVQLETIPKGSQIWIVSDKGLPFTEWPMRSDVQSALSNIVTYIAGTTGGMQVDTGIKLGLKLKCISPEGAQRVHDALRGAIGLARLSTKDDQLDMLKVYDAIEVNQTGNVVDVKAAMNAAEVDKLMTYLPQVRSRIGQLAQ